jgi:DNA-binding MarR family transcriptional regulator
MYGSITTQIAERLSIDRKTADMILEKAVKGGEITNRFPAERWLAAPLRRITAQAGREIWGSCGLI